MTAYLDAWRTQGAHVDPQRHTIAETVESSVNERVYGWPTISSQPCAELDDGRLVKSHPLLSPVGMADLRQARLRGDFSAAEWAQHLIRYYDGRFLSTSHGQRVIWAIFNTVMREETRKVGSLVLSLIHI